MAGGEVRFVQPDLNRRLLAIVVPESGAELRVRIQRGERGWQWKCDLCSRRWRTVWRVAPCEHVEAVVTAMTERRR